MLAGARRRMVDIMYTSSAPSTRSDRDQVYVMYTVAVMGAHMIVRVHLGLFALAGCLVGNGGESNASYENDVASSERGLDYAWSRPSSPQALRSAGYSFVARYLSYDTTGKNLSAGEA